MSLCDNVGTKIRMFTAHINYIIYLCYHCNARTNADGVKSKKLQAVMMLR